MVPSLPIAGDEKILLFVVYFHFVVFVCGPMYCDWPVLLLSWWNLGWDEIFKLAAETAPEMIIDPINIKPKKITTFVNLDRLIFSFTENLHCSIMKTPP